MRRLLAGFSAGLCVAACSHEPPTAIAVTSSSAIRATVDQSQPAGDPAAGVTFAVGGPAAQVLAQVVTAGVDGRLRQVDLPIACDAGTLVLEVRDVVGGVPGTTVLASESYAASSFDPFTPGVTTFASLRIAPAPTIAAGTSFALVLSDPTGSCGIIPGPVGDPYAGGSAYFFDTTSSTWVNLSLGNGRDDLPFFTYVQP